jgi:hypothetical protein
MILVTIEFPNGSRINLGENGIWSGNDEMIVKYANNFKKSSQYYPDPIAGLAEEIIETIGGKMIFIRPYNNSAPPGVDY